MTQPKSDEFWEMSWRTDPDARQLADRHYNRQTPGADGFVPPGRCCVLKSIDRRAFWVTSWPFGEYVKHAWPGLWVCSAFRNERAGEGMKASDMIVQAVAATRAVWPDHPSIWFEDGLGWGDHLTMITFVNEAKVRRSRTPGRCFIKAGFRPIGYTKGGLLALGLCTEDLPEPSPAVGHQERLFD